MFRSLGIPAFRLWVLGALVSGIGSWMQTTAQSWAVITDLTPGDARAMGIVIAAQYLPQVALAGITGSLADRFDRRRILLLTQALMMALSCVIGALLLTGLMTLPLMTLLALGGGLIAAFDTPARQAFVGGLVPPDSMVNAIALNASAWNTARLVGPAAAGGLLLLVSTGWLFLINALTFVAMLLVLMRMPAAPPVARREGARVRASDGFRYILGRGDLLVALAMAFLAGCFSMNFALFAATMTVEFDAGAGGLGVLTSMLAVGSLTGALLAARAKSPRIGTAAVCSLAVGVAILVAAAMPHYLLFAVLLIVAGAGSAQLFAILNTYVQSSSAPAVRGRVLAVYLAMVLGSAPVGAPVFGAIATATGPRAALVTAALTSVAAAVIGTLFVVRRRRRR